MTTRTIRDIKALLQYNVSSYLITNLFKVTNWLHCIITVIYNYKQL